MFKRSRLITIICIALLGIVAMLSMTLISILPKLSDLGNDKLVFTSESLSAVYDGNALSADGWELAEGSLKKGHKAVVSVKGSQKNVGTSENYFTVKITDKNGVDVTDEYDIENRPGSLTVTPAIITITSATDAKVYDGTPLTSSGYTVLPSYAVPPKHELAVEVTGSITDIGSTPNTVSSVRIYNQSGKDITYNFDIVVVEGILTVAKDAASLPGAGGSMGGDFELNLDTDGDGFPDINLDIDSDGFPDLNIDNNGDKIPDKNIDIDGDGNPDVNIGDGFGNNDIDIGGLLGGLAGIVGGVGGVDTSGVIGTTGSGNTGAGEEGVAYVINSQKSGKVYLKVISYGGYTGNTWKDAVPYGKLVRGTHSAAYLTSFALENSGATPYSMTVKIMNGQLVMPYHAFLDESGLIQTSDTYVGGEFDTVVNYRFYPHTFNSATVSLGAGDAEYELAYRKFVYENYLDIDLETYEYMQGLIAENGFSRSSPNVIKDVAEYISGKAKYNLDYDRALDSESNIAIAFLEKYGEGICQHYATSATLLYRALGIPARYTIGFVGNAMANVDCNVTVKNAHAWVEVYIDGVGWVVSEVTGSGFGNNGQGNQGGGETGEITRPEPEKSITIYPAFCDKLYDGKPLVSDGTIGIKDSDKGMSAEDFHKNYRYEALISGERVEPGKSVSTITSIKIFDKNDVDVTDEFEIKMDTGVLHVYISELVFGSEGRIKPYDGTPLVGVIGDVYYDDGSLAEGHTYEISVSKQSSIIDAGKCSNHFTVKIFDADGDDVTDIYKITRKLGMLTVIPREITITAGSDSKVYDGTPLTCNEAFISSGSLAFGESILNYVVEGSQTNRGKHQNIVKEVVIVNSDGDDVTKNYSITFVAGQLTVTSK